MSFSPDEKVELVTAWFNEIDGIITELKHLMSANGSHHEKIVMLTLYAILERMAWFRYRLQSSITTSERFKKILIEYSGYKSDLEKTDLYFLYHWDVSGYENISCYKKIIGKIHGKIKTALTELYGKIDSSSENRFIEANILHQGLLSKNICSTCFDKDSLKFFNVTEVIYRFGRCNAVHQAELVPLGFIRPSFLMSLTEAVSQNLRKTCIDEKKLADEL